MKKSLLLWLIYILSVSAAAEIQIIPQPLELQTLPGTYTLSASTQIFYDASIAGLDGYVLRFAEKLRVVTGLPLPTAPLTAGAATTDIIVFDSAGVSPEWGDEGYQLQVTSAGVHMIAQAPPGFFYAAQTLYQLLPVEVESKSAHPDMVWSLPGVLITDSPRFRWRGMHLDVCRHFFSVDFVKKYIDMLAMYKMNVFHWHLTDDQGWRIEIKKYPLLTDVGAWRKGTLGDGIPHGGFYTQAEIREVVAYAAERAITIVPEIEMPGHSTAAIAAYPWLSCTGAAIPVQTNWGIFGDVFCPGKETTFTFLEDVLSEVMELFPSPFIHVGGDECPKDRWRAHDLCQKRMQEEGLNSEAELQSYFTRRIEAFLRAHGRRLIGWDEILEGGIAPNAAVMSWRGFEGGVAAARSGHEVVMSPTSHCYFDYYQAQQGEPKAIGGYVPIEQVYSLEPVPSALTPDESRFILGAQANLWTEYIATERHAEYMLFPRLCALSEVAWTQVSLRDYEDFDRRMEGHFKRLQAADINARFESSAWFDGSSAPQAYGELVFSGADPRSGLRIGEGARIGSDGVLWIQTGTNSNSSVSWTLLDVEDMRATIPFFSLTISYKVQSGCDTLFFGLVSQNGKRFYTPILPSAANFDYKWHTLTKPLREFTAEAGFDSTQVVQISMWCNQSKDNIWIFLADLWKGSPSSYPAPHPPIIFFDGFDYNQTFRVKGFSNAAASAVETGAGCRPGTNALRWQPLPNMTSMVRWRFDPLLDMRNILIDDTLKLALKAPVDADTLNILCTSKNRKNASFTLDRSAGYFDGAWHNLQIPLRNFTAETDFDTSQIELFSFSTRVSQSGLKFYLSDIWIGQPSDETVSSVAAAGKPLGVFHLAQNYPNPFNPLTTIAYQLPQRSRVRLTIHNVLGQCVATLVDAPQAQGEHHVQWDARTIASGHYYCRLQVNDFTQIRKMVLMR